MDFSLTSTWKHINEIWDGKEPTFHDKIEKPSIMKLLTSKNDPVGKHTKNHHSQLDQFDKNAATDYQFYCPFYYEEDMAPIVGTYQHERNENLDDYLKSVGVPYVPRKIMTVSNPKLEITNQGDEWTIRTITMMRTLESSFSLNKEYNETMPSGDVLKNTAKVEGDSLIIVSIAPNGKKVTRKYDFTNDDLVLTMKNENDGHVAKRYFKRIS